MATPAKAQSSKTWTTPATSSSLPRQNTDLDPGQFIKSGLLPGASSGIPSPRANESYRAMTPSRGLDPSTAWPRSFSHGGLAVESVSAPDRNPTSARADTELGRSTAQSGSASSQRTEPEIGTLKRKIQQKLVSTHGLHAVNHNHSQAAFDALIYGQGSSSTQGEVLEVSVSRPLASPTQPGNGADPPDKPMYGHIDPRVHWPQQRSEKWREKKMKQIELRGHRKARFGKAFQSLHRNLASNERPASFEDTLPEKIQHNPDWVRLLKRLARVPGLNTRPAPQLAKRGQKNKRLNLNESPP